MSEQIPGTSSVDGPFSGLTIIDMTRVLAGPFCSMMLADLGARVIKVEPPQGDDARSFGPWVNGQSAYFMSLNRGKESIALDLKSTEDRKLFEAMLEKADVLLENFRPGAMDKLGYGWSELQNKFPRLIYAACSGFGQTGPYSKRPAYDMVVQGMGGIMSLTGHENSPPTRVGTAIGDIAAGLFTTIGVSGALYERERSGKGQFVDVAMLDCQLAILENAVARFFATGESPPPSGARHPSIAPFECYSSKDGFIIIAAGNDSLFETLCRALEAPGLAQDERFSSNKNRMENVVALKTCLEDILVTRATADWLTLLEEAGVPCGPLNSVGQALSSPQIAARNMVVGIDDPDVGSVKIAGNPIKMSNHDDATIRGPVPKLDQNRERLVKEFTPQDL